MTPDLNGRSFLKLLDYTPDEIRYLIDLAAELKRKKHAHEATRFLEGRNVVLLFEKTSTRTRCSFEVGAMDLGMGVTYLEPGCSQMGKKESIADTARVLGRMYDGIEYRGFAQTNVECLAEMSGVPVWNGLTTEFHPTQMLADMLTVREHFGSLAGHRLTFMGDAGNNVGNSLMVVCAKLGIDFCACGPEEQMPAPALVATCREVAAQSGSSITLTSDVAAGVAGSDVIYTDIWVSMGEDESVWPERIKLLESYRVTDEVMDAAATDAVFLHCLPSYHDTNTQVGKHIAEAYGIKEMEVTDHVFESGRSLVFDEAENRMHTIKAVMYATLGHPVSDLGDAWVGAAQA
ncbi:MAG: ornithine carbamoyltransferase [Atopobiaceae bacterium]|jgi:ornithine carbamoyltransferase|nr:ornithine carbamoyltransferase [Atopobiaceae bacterium]MCH4213854.1 ornithine carbamoyltransferase [Atopobiaceae bacterium]MCH4229956.1 ornithine carbamoyltransferase [Atopobiaceae bacterium]MCH4275683.1 ornithine carbamoyltransferase [Atopobiaceae bacterium]MCI1226210.1 ornithine carbamoyltransferase [Atopobiaceae bacterium]